ncbi:MAG: class I SAM-dependent DNA methyltransferase [Roseomonas sp.]|nr:class I SAM-dependent DNA methyltransferase [Roseomonas sp.]
MPLSLNEIRDRATAFAREYRDASNENAEAQSFWGDFFKVFGINARRVGAFERPAQNLASQSGRGRIDYLWKGVVLVEHKSRGQDLDRAAGQARDYFPSLKDSELPRYIIVSDFARIRLYDLEADQTTEFALAELPRRLGLFGFISGYTTRNYGSLNAVDVEAAEKLGLLHDLLEDDGFGGKALDVWMVRTLFCLFADNAGIFETGIFRALIETRSAEDGSDLGALITRLHRVLATPEHQRQKSLDESLAAFPYVNGRLFDAPVEQPETNMKMRAALLDCARVDWSRVSPAIFGSLFQSIKNRAERRRGGEHYTTEANILKCLDPLFLDGLRAELAAAKQDARRLNAFLLRLRRIRIFDPACGCGNFLVVAYRELRRLELEALRRRYGGDDAGQLVGVVLSQVNVDQMFGIEVEDWPAQIAQVALWLTDHQLNMELSQEFGQLRLRLPLTTAPQILVGNALREDWAGFVKPGADAYCVGNPPFIGHQYRSAEQQADMHMVWGRDGKVNRLDYVTCWYRKGVDWMAGDDRAECCFVSTNSICQGEQVGTLWGELLQRGVRIRFAHRTFQWTSEARGKAAVHCVIIGFGLREPARRLLFDYPNIRGEPQQIEARNINPYLVDAVDVLLPSRTETPPSLPQLKKGSQPTDGGHLVLNEAEKDTLLQQEPGAEAFLRQYLGGEELINGNHRWCLWLKDADLKKLRAMPKIMARISAVKAARLKSPTPEVQRYADFPTLFTQDRQPHSDYLALPEVSSENRRFVPMAFLPPSIVASNKLQIIVGATNFHFAILNSTMHMAWMRVVAGRLESRYSYAPAVYNNFPWPTPTEAQRAAIERSAQGILDARAAHPGASLADLYDPLTMPPNLVAAHAANDRAVDAAYGQPRGFPTEAARLAFLFDLYQSLVAPLDATPTRRRPRPRRSQG